MKAEHPSSSTNSSPDIGTRAGWVIDLKWPKFSLPQVFNPIGESEYVGTTLDWRWVLLEWLLIFIVVSIFSAGFLDLGTQRALPGNEAEIFQSLDWVLINSLKQYGQFPLWNPYLRTGLPFIADPMLHVYNPLVAMPVLLFGVMDGFKIALFLSFLAAGLGMWWFGVILGMGRVSRLWIAFMYAFAGPPVARFSQGQYLFILGFAWIPWVLASLKAVTQTRRRLHAAIASMSMALLFLSGNVYYTYYMLFAIILYTLITLFDIRFTKPFLVFNQSKAWVLIVTGGLALGLIAIQLLPLVEFWPRISKAINPALTDSQTIKQVFLDYLSKDKWRPDAIKTLPPEEFYAYIGIWPFLALLLLPFAVWRRENKKPFLFLALLFVFTLLWVDIRDMPWRDFYVRTPFLNQFRYPTRMLIYGACAIITLAGLALDSFWKLVWSGETALPKKSAVDVTRWSLPWIGVAVLSMFMIGSVADVYSTNKQHAQTRDPYPISYEIMNWLSRFDSSEYYVGNPNGWHGSVVSNRLRYIDAWYHFSDIRQLKDTINQRPVRARPNYLVLGNDQTPNFPDPVTVKRFETHTIYKLPHSLPFAFTVKNEELAQPKNHELQNEDVSALLPFIPGPNGVEIITQSELNSTLVILMTNYPGWQVTVDGHKQKLKIVGGYLATELRAGVHKYVFSFSATSFKIGLVISGLALLATFSLLVSDLRFYWQKAIARFHNLRSSVGTLVDWWERPATSQPATSHAVQLEMLEFAEVADAQEPSIPLIPSAVVRWWRLASVNWSVWLSNLAFLEWTLFTLTLLVYAVTRLRALDQFPIYFFTDEAIQPLLAEGLIKRGFRGPDGALFPIYFEAAGHRWTPIISVYLHALTMGLFGKSILVTRATSALVSLIGVAAIGLILKLIFKARFWWVGALFMTITPAWFLHSRTGFETVVMTSFYACFLLFYLLYRHRSPRYLFIALLFGTASFYAYSNGQVLMAVAGVLLFASDIRYHLRHWRTVLLAVLLGAILALPLITFRLDHPTSMQEHLRAINSYWFQAISFKEKITRLAQTYGYGLSPQYWFFPNDHDLARHRMAGYGHIRTEILPLVLIGVVLCLWHIRSSSHRTILLAALATPAGAALVDVGITRVLAFVVPASILATLGLEILLSRLTRHISYDLVATGVFLVLLVISFSMLRQALVEGPLWFRDYGLYGMQYGAKQLFEETIPQYLERDPNIQVMVSSSWANGTDRFIPFFLSSDQQRRVHMRNVDAYLFEKLNLSDNIMLITTPQEYERARTSPKFKAVEVERVVPYPDGTPGFYFTRLEYADNVDAIFAADREARRQPVEEQIELDGQTVRIRHSRFDMGQAHHMFDNDRFTLARGLEANPLMVELLFPQPRTVTGLAADFATMDFTLTVELYEDGTDKPVTYVETYRDLPPDPHVEIDFDRGPHTISRIRLKIKHLEAGETAHIHIRELALN